VGPFLPQHNASLGREWKRSLHVWSIAANMSESCSGQMTMAGHPVCRLGMELTTSHLQELACYEIPEALDLD
jgi:hypothetical protein